MNEIDKMKKMVDSILGDDDLCEGCIDESEGLTCDECRRKYADKIIKILRMPEVVRQIADTPQLERSKQMTIKLSKVKSELNEWRDIIGDDIVNAIISNLEEEADEDESSTYEEIISNAKLVGYQDGVKACNDEWLVRLGYKSQYGEW